MKIITTLSGTKLNVITINITIEKEAKQQQIAYFFACAGLFYPIMFPTMPLAAKPTPKGIIYTKPIIFIIVTLAASSATPIKPLKIVINSKAHHSAQFYKVDGMASVMY